MTLKVKEGGQLHTVADTGLTQDVGDVVLHRGHGDEKLILDLLVGFAHTDETDDLLSPAC